MNGKINEKTNELIIVNNEIDLFIREIIGKFNKFI